ncbi:hypothetical protein YC2023_066496 [Brassica napus]
MNQFLTHILFSIQGYEKCQKIKANPALFNKILLKEVNGKDDETDSQGSTSAIQAHKINGHDDIYIGNMDRGTKNVSSDKLCIKQNVAANKQCII